LIKNKFFNDLQSLYQKGTNVDELKELLGRARAKKGMFEGDLEEGELEIGQIAGLIDSIQPAAEIVEEIITEFEAAKQSVSEWLGF
jgi:enoyl-[acyl-carrier protein] reductase II